MEKKLERLNDRYSLNLIMKNLNISIIIFIIVFSIVYVSLAIYFSFLKGEFSIIPIKECTKDSDCKLIYGNCGCAAVPIEDPRKFLEASKAICKWNICHGTNITVVCRYYRCIKNK